MSKPWITLTAENIAALPAQLGVYEIADSDGVTRKFGYAGGKEAFGMRTALERELATLAGDVDQGRTPRFRHEFTHGYLTRWQELLMVHVADHGELPAGNADHVCTLGRLSPLSESRST